MLTKEENDFVDYWEKIRQQERSLSHQLKSGLYVGLIFCSAVLVMVFSGWYKRADMMVNSNGSYILVIILALVVISVVFAVFYKRQQWDRKEQQYNELMAKKRKSEKQLQQL